ncbi:MAG TPA: hypothetical protein VGF48_08190 [Thermoanaerobaculia bacterium]
MENRERDRVSQRISPTEAGEVNRKTEERKGQEEGSSVEFGKNIARSENLDEDNDTGRTGDSPGRH